MKFLNELQQRNKILYWFGWLNLAAAITCLLMTQVTATTVLGINAWIKPMKFYFSITIFCWSMGWFMYHLNSRKGARAYSLMVVIVFIFEMSIITWQAANGRLSHFNISSPLYGMLFNLMGIAITILCIWTAVIGYRFFKQKQFNAPMAYIWGIRLGILLLVIFSFEGAFMAVKLSHTVGGEQGGPGLPVVNWSKQYGDLRIAHFFGMHALQLLPLLGYFVLKTKQQIIGFAILYFLAVMALFLQAMKGVPLFS
ncbi:MAG TPA: hypothetical protein VF487_13800 [Chitinophagaceae bacterium]